MSTVETTIEHIAAQWRVQIDPLAGDAALAENVSEARFTNPAAYHINNTATAVVNFVVSGEGEEAAQSQLDDLARLLALRVSAPSASLGCFFGLRNLVADQAANLSLSGEALSAALSRVDACLLHTVDAIAQSREKLSALAMEELKKRNEMLEKLNNESSMQIGGQ